jgi:tRNA modification GTPase
MSDTIFAMATARGKAGVAVIRISGPNALAAAESFGLSGLQPRRAALRKLIQADDLIDEAVVIYFPKGESFTGEEVIEFQVHGSSAILSRLLSGLSDLDGLRMAEPGEFTRRALMNGRLNLTQVEGLADLIDAETEAQRRQAQRVLSGAIGEKVEAWRALLVRAAALVEATIDFADEEVPVDVAPEVLQIIDALVAELRKEVAAGVAAERIRDGYEVILLGAPNSGKSSLLNALAGRDAAITSSVAGTTRDVIEVRMDLRGLPVTVLDTAGLRDTTDEVERLGIAWAKRRAKDADLRIMLIDPGQPTPDFELGDDDIRVVVKADLYPDQGEISSRSGQGLSQLVDGIAERLATRAAHAGILVRERHRIAVSRAIDALYSARRWMYEGAEASELVAADLRMAARSLEVLVGRIGVEDLLGEIFSSFCIGK